MNNEAPADSVDSKQPPWIKFWISRYVEYIDIDSLEEYQENELNDFFVGIGKVFINLLCVYQHHNEPEAIKYAIKDKYFKTLYRILKRDLDQTFIDYIETARRSRENGKKGGRPPLKDSGSDTKAPIIKHQNRKSNTFTNIEKSDYDFDELEKKILNK